MTFPVVQGQRVALREYRVEDKDTIQPWLGEVVSAAGIADPVPRPANEQAPQTIREGLPLGGSRSGTLVIQLVSEGEPLGFLEYEFARGWLAVPFIALAKPYRGWGYGSEAVRLLEGWAQSERVPKRFRADVPVGNGLALYFWLRLGYRPKSASAGDGHAVMMMVREIETGRVRPVVSSNSGQIQTRGEESEVLYSRLMKRSIGDGGGFGSASCAIASRGDVWR